MNLYAFSNFIEFLNFQIRHNNDTKGYKSRLAEAAEVQRSFLTQVLKHHVLLTPDHALKLCRFWNFDEEETDYFLNLIHLSRAQNLQSRKFYESKIKKTQEKHQDLKERLKPEKELSITEKNIKYYSSWVYGAVHMTASIPKLNTTDKISKYLALPFEKVEKVLQELLQMGLVERNAKQEWKAKVNNLHLPKQSSLTISNHSHWRQRALQEFHTGALKGIHYSLVFAMSKQDGERLREMILNFFESLKSVIGPSPEEELYVYLCDYFSLAPQTEP